MKILALADHECTALWDYYRPGMLKEYDLILSAGDLRPEYLSFLVTMARAPLMYVHGNHDSCYDYRSPDGCDCIDDNLVIYNGLRILGLGGSRRYSDSKYQYTERQMKKRLRKLERAIRLAGGVDIVLAHGAPLGVGDGEDFAHQGFETFLELIEKYQPRYFLHGHVHMNYGGVSRMKTCGQTQVINCWERFVLDCEPAADVPEISLLQKLTPRELVFAE